MWSCFSDTYFFQNEFLWHTVARNFNQTSPTLLLRLTQRSSLKKKCSRGGRYQLDSSLVRLRTASYISTGTQNSFSINSYLSRCFPSKPGASRSNPARFDLILLPIEGKRKKKSCLKQEARRQFTLNHTKHCLLKMGGKARSQRVEWIRWRCWCKEQHSSWAVLLLFVCLLVFVSTHLCFDVLIFAWWIILALLVKTGRRRLQIMCWSFRLLILSILCLQEQQAAMFISFISSFFISFLPVHVTQEIQEIERNKERERET